VNTVTSNIHIQVIYRGDQAEYVVRILVAAPQEYVVIYSTRRVELQTLPCTAPPWTSPPAAPSGGR